MFKLPQRETKTLVTVHGWSGVVLGLLLYAVICTGVGAVFATEINEWASPLSHPKASVFKPGVDAAVRKLAAEVDAEFHEHISVYEGAGGRAHVLFYRHDTGPDGKPAERGVDFETDPATWEVLERRDGWLEDIYAGVSSSAVADFLVNLHVRLHIPDPYGLFVTGVLGLVMMVAAVTGLLIHRHLIKDLFTLRRKRDPVLERRDLHAVAGSWNLPFAFILAFTGSFFSFASSVGIPAVAMVRFAGDQEAMIDTLYGAARPENADPSSLASLESILAHARTRGAIPNFVSVEHFGRGDAVVSVYSDPRSDRLVSPSFLYAGTTGEFLRDQPALGQAPSIGATLVGLMYPLHFGNFAGAFSKAVWVALGFAGAYVTLTGMLLWVKRRQEQRVWRGFARAVHWVGYGLPLALLCAPIAFFFLRSSTIPPDTIQGFAFLAVAGATGIAAMVVADLANLRRAMLTATGVALLVLPVARMVTGGMGWMNAIENGLVAVPAIDLALLVCAAACLWNIFGVARKSAAGVHVATRRVRTT